MEQYVKKLFEQEKKKRKLSIKVKKIGKILLSISVNISDFTKFMHIKKK